MVLRINKVFRFYFIDIYGQLGYSKINYRIFYVEDFLIFYNVECFFKWIIYFGVFFWLKFFCFVIFGGCCLFLRSFVVIMMFIFEQFLYKDVEVEFCVMINMYLIK